MRSLIKNPLLRAALAAVTLGMLVTTASAGASPLIIYQNDLDTAKARGQAQQVAPKANCKRGGSPKAFRFELGIQAKECFFRIPVVGRDLQITATARILESTPPKILKRTYAGVSLRQNIDGSRYQFVVWPASYRYGLRKVMPNGRIVNLGSKQAGRKVKGPGKANRITLRAFNGPKGGALLIGFVNGHKVVTSVDERGNELIGRDSTISIGSKGFARGAVGSFSRVRISMPDPF